MIVATDNALVLPQIHTLRTSHRYTQMHTDHILLFFEFFICVYLCASVADQFRELGGRATAFADRTTGERVDNGQHVLLGCYRETFTLLRRIGAEGHVRIQPTLEVPYLDAAGRRSVLRCARSC